MDTKHSESLEESLTRLTEMDRAHLEPGMGMAKAFGGALYGMDLLAFGALNRSKAHIAGFRALIGQRNLICAGALLRLQLDTAMRFFAASSAAALWWGGVSQCRVFGQTADNILACCENASWAWAGAPRTLVIDDLKAAVLKADWYDPELAPELATFCRHYGTVLLPTGPRTPRHKGKVERGIGYVQSNAPMARRFDSLAAQNAHSARWETQAFAEN